MDQLPRLLLNLMIKINSLCIAGNVNHKELIVHHRDFNRFYKIANVEQQGAYHEEWVIYLNRVKINEKKL